MECGGSCELMPCNATSIWFVLMRWTALWLWSLTSFAKTLRINISEFAISLICVYFFSCHWFQPFLVSFCSLLSFTQNERVQRIVWTPLLLLQSSLHSVSVLLSECHQWRNWRGGRGVNHSPWQANDKTGPILAYIFVLKIFWFSVGCCFLHVSEYFPMI